MLIGIIKAQKGMHMYTYTIHIYTGIGDVGWFYFYASTDMILNVAVIQNHNNPSFGVLKLGSVKMV